MLARLRATLAMELDGFPDHADPQTGAWSLKPNGDCTGGFFVGWLWLAAREDDAFLAAARDWAERLRPRIPSRTHYRGMLFYYGTVLGAELLGDPGAGALTLAVARALRDSVNPNTGVIPLGEEGEESSNVGPGETTVDAIGMISGVLAWASRETGDPSYREIARRHALTHIDWCVRDDGSVCQSASFDTATGALTRRYTHKGHAPDSTWGRAQGWALVGYTLSALWMPEEPRFLETAERIADWWIDNVPEDRVAFWDFGDPAIPDTYRDTSATAIAAASLLKLAGLTSDPERAARYEREGTRTVRALVERHLTPVGADDAQAPGSLIDACYHPTIGHAVRCEAVWADYYLFEALTVLGGLLPRSRI
jgi:unsaturated chondroitin disaccharide hydrolase